MTDFDKLVEQQEAISKKIKEASNDELVGIKKRLEVMAKATGRSIPDLLGLKKATTTQKKSPAKKVDAAKDKKYRDWIKASKDQTHKIGGKETVIHSKTRLTQNIRDYVDSLGA